MFILAFFSCLFWLLCVYMFLFSRFNPSSLARAFICHCLTWCWIRNFIKPLNQELFQRLLCLIPPTPGKAIDGAWQENSLGKSLTFQGETLGTEGRAGQGTDNPIADLRALLTPTAPLTNRFGVPRALCTLWIRALICFLREESLINRRFCSEWICFVKFCLSQLCIEPVLSLSCL